MRLIEKIAIEELEKEHKDAKCWFCHRSPEEIRDYVNDSREYKCLMEEVGWRVDTLWGPFICPICASILDAAGLDSIETCANSYFKGDGVLATEFEKLVIAIVKNMKFRIDLEELEEEKLRT